MTATLHLVSGSASTELLADCIAAASKGDVIILTGEAVYLPLLGVASRAIAAADTSLRIVALARDLDERGMGTRAAALIEVIDDHEMVRLAVACPRSMSWY